MRFGFHQPISAVDSQLSRMTIDRKAKTWEDAFVIVPSDANYPYSWLQILGFAILVLFPTLSLTVCGLRVYSRRLANGFGTGELPIIPYVLQMLSANICYQDDWLIFFAMVGGKYAFERLQECTRS